MKISKRYAADSKAMLVIHNHREQVGAVLGRSQSEGLEKRT